MTFEALKVTDIKTVSLGICCHIVWFKGTNILENPAASIFTLNYFISIKVSVLKHCCGCSPLGCYCESHFF